MKLSDIKKQTKKCCLVWLKSAWCTCLWIGAKRTENHGKKDLIQLCGMKEWGILFWKYDASVPPQRPQESAHFPQTREPWWKSCVPTKNRQTLSRTFLFARRGRPPLRSHQSYLCLRGLCTLARKELRPEFREYKWLEMADLTPHVQIMFLIFFIMTISIMDKHF